MPETKARPLQFVHGTNTYAIEFERYRPAGDRHGEPGQPYTFPYTTARLMIETQAKAGEIEIHGFHLYREWTVGCWHKEKRYTLETGRLRALRGLSRGLTDLGLKQALWKCYLGRPKGGGSVKDKSLESHHPHELEPPPPTLAAGPAREDRASDALREGEWN